MQRFLTSDYPKLLELLYDAALDPERWQAFLDALPACFGGANGVLHFYKTDAGTTSISMGFGFDPTFAASFQNYYAGVNPYPSTRFRTLRVGEVAYSSTVLPVETVEKTEFFNDWMKPQGISSDHFGLLLQDNNLGNVILGIAPHASVHSRHRGTYATQLQLLAPHMVRAIKINRTTSASRIAGQALGGALETLGVAAFLVGRAGRILIANTRAEALMRSERILVVDSFKTLRAASTAEGKALSAAIAAAETLAIKHDRQPLRLTSCMSGRAYAAWVLPIRPPRNEAMNLRFELFSGVGARPVALILVTPAERGITIQPGAIQVVFELSPAEARLASALAAGRTMDEYAIEARLSRNTVRNQLGSIFAKTATTRQTQLVALIVGALGPGN